MDSVTEARCNIDEAIDKWLIAQGLTIKQIRELNYTALNEELEDLLGQI